MKKKFFFFKPKKVGGVCTSLSSVCACVVCVWCSLCNWFKQIIFYLQFQTIYVLKHTRNELDIHWVEGDGLWEALMHLKKYIL